MRIKSRNVVYIDDTSIGRNDNLIARGIPLPIFAHWAQMIEATKHIEGFHKKEDKSFHKLSKRFKKLSNARDL